MSKSGKITNGPFWSQNWFEAMWRFTCNNFVNFDTGAVDFEALGREEYEFRKALFFRNFKNSKRARSVFDEAKAEYDKKVENGMKGGRPKKNQDTTADGDTREDSLNITTVRKDGKLESGTSANIYGDASHREAEDESATVSKNMRRVPQNEAPAHGFSGGRAAQGTMSRPPEAAAQSGKVYDQVAYHSISTDEKPTGGHLLPSSSRPPVGNRHAAVDVLNLAYAGEFGNVRLTQEQYAQLGIKFGNQQKLNRAIDSLSCQIENGEKKPANHYAELVKWANYRDDMEERKEEEASKPKMTEMEKSWIEAMKRVEAM
jgi:hypothetical protein